VAPGQSFYFAGKRSWIDLFVKQASDGNDEGGDGTIVQMPKDHDYLGKYFWRLSETHELRLAPMGAHTLTLGGELHATHTALSGWLAVSWARSQRHNDLTGEAFRFAYDQPLIVNAVGVYPFGHGWQTSAKWTYHTGTPDTAVVGTYTDTSGRLRPLYGPLNGERLPPYHRLDLRVEKQVSRDFHFYVELINAYNRRNVSGWSYSADYQSRTPVEQLGLLPTAGLRVDF